MFDSLSDTTSDYGSDVSELFDGTIEKKPELNPLRKGKDRKRKN